MGRSTDRVSTDAPPAAMSAMSAMSDTPSLPLIIASKLQLCWMGPAFSLCGESGVPQMRYEGPHQFGLSEWLTGSLEFAQAEGGLQRHEPCRRVPRLVEQIERRQGRDEVSQIG